MPPTRPHRPRRHPAHHVLRLILRSRDPSGAGARRTPREDGGAVHPTLHTDDVGQRIQYSHVHVAPGPRYLSAGRGAGTPGAVSASRGSVFFPSQVRLPRRGGGDGGVVVDQRAALHRLRGVAGVCAQGPGAPYPPRRRVRLTTRRLERSRVLPQDRAPVV